MFIENCLMILYFFIILSFDVCHQQHYSLKSLHHAAVADHQNDDGRSLKDGKEIVVHLKAKQMKEYHFNIQEDDTSVWMVVTPCGGFVKWKLAQQVDDSNDDEANSEFGSGILLNFEKLNY